MNKTLLLYLILAVIVGCKTTHSLTGFLVDNQIELVVYKTTPGRTNRVIVEELLTGDSVEFTLPEEYSLYESITQDGNNLIISFQKMDGYSALYSGILHYSIDKDTIIELFRSDLKNFIHFRLAKSDTDNTFTFYDGSIYSSYNLESGEMIELGDSRERKRLFTVYDKSSYEMKEVWLYRTAHDGLT